MPRVMQTVTMVAARPRPLGQRAADRELLVVGVGVDAHRRGPGARARPPSASSCRARGCPGCRSRQSRSMRPSCELGSPFALGDGVAPAAQDEDGPSALVPEMRPELLEREAAEPRRERAAPDPAVEPPALALERGRVERLPVVAGQDELETVERALAPSGTSAAPAGRRRGCPRPRTSSARPGTPRASVPPACGSWRAGRSGASGDRGPRSRRGRPGPRRRPGSGTRASPSHSSPARAAQSHRRTRAR